MDKKILSLSILGALFMSTNTMALTDAEQQALKDNVDANNVLIADNTADIATNTGDIATNTGNIATNTGDIATNTGNIATNTGGIATNTGNIATNTSDIGDIRTDMTDVETELYSTTARSMANSERLDKVEKRVTFLETEVESIKRGLAGVAAISGLVEPKDSGDTVISIGFATVVGESAVALGGIHRRDNIAFKVAGAVDTSFEEVTMSASVGFSF